MSHFPFIFNPHHTYWVIAYWKISSLSIKIILFLHFVARILDHSLLAVEVDHELVRGSLLGLLVLPHLDQSGESEADPSVGIHLADAAGVDGGKLNSG